MEKQLKMTYNNGYEKTKEEAHGLIEVCFDEEISPNEFNQIIQVITYSTALRRERHSPKKISLSYYQKTDRV